MAVFATVLSIALSVPFHRLDPRWGPQQLPIASRFAGGTESCQKPCQEVPFRIEKALPSMASGENLA